jgi:hypothetical protein
VPAWSDTLDRGGCLLRVEILCGLPLKRLGSAIGWGRTFEGTVCANENELKDTCVGSVSTGEDDVYWIEVEMSMRNLRIIGLVL